MCMCMCMRCVRVLRVFENVKIEKTCKKETMSKVTNVPKCKKKFEQNNKSPNVKKKNLKKNVILKSKNQKMYNNEKKVNFQKKKCFKGKNEKNEKCIKNVRKWKMYFVRKKEKQIEHYSTNLMRSLCVSSAFTVKRE